MRASSLVVALLCAAPALGQSRGAFLHTPPAEVALGTPVKIEGNLVAGSFARVVLRVRNGTSEWDDEDLELQYGDLYRGTIPGSHMVPPGLDYYVEGITSAGEHIAIFATAAAPIHFKIGNEPAGAADENPFSDKPEKAEKPEKEKPLDPALNPKCKKKKGKKLPRECEEPPVVKKEKEKDPEPEPETPPVKPERAQKPDKVEKTEKPERREPEKRQKEAVRDPPPPPREQPREASPPRKKSALDEELAVYGAEASGAVVQRVDDRERVRPQSPTVLTHDQLRTMGVRYVHEALDLVPGLTVTRDMQGFYRVGVRGLRSDAEVMFTLNGQRLNDVYDGKALASLPIDTLERIEIFRGPATADVGLGNVTALINLVTNRDEGLRLSASGGSYEAFDGHLSAAKAFGGLKLFVDGDVASQYGERRPVLRDGLDGTVPRPKTTSDQRLLINAGLGASYQSEGLGTLSVSGRFIRENRTALVGQFDVVGPSSRLQWQVIQAGLGWTRPLSESATLAVKAWVDLQSTTRLWQISPDNYQVRANDPATFFDTGVREQVAFGTRAIGGEGRLDLALPAKNHLVATLSAEQQSLSSFSYLTNYVTATYANVGSLTRPDGLAYATEDGKGGRGLAADRFNLGVSVADTWAVVDALAVQAGVRFDLTQLPRADATGFIGGGFTPSIGPRLGLVITPVSSLSFRAFYGRSFRAPTMQELAESIPASDSSQGRNIGNPQLQGANLDSVELGFDYVEGVGDGRLRLKGQGFFERMGNAIVGVDSTGALVPYTNRPQGVQAVGLEGEARLELTSRVTVWLNASWVRAEDLGTPQSARLLTDQSQLRLNGGVSLPIGRWLAFDVITRFASERRNDSRTVLELLRKYTLPPSTIFTVQLRTEPLFDHLVLAVLAQNVFNLDRADDAFRPDRVTGGVPREGLLVFGSARVVF